MAGRFVDRILPSPTLSLGLLGLWLLLNQSLAIAHWLLGGLLALVVPLVTRSLRPESIRWRRPIWVMRLVGRVAWDVVRSNVVIARSVLLRRPPQSDFVIVPLDIRNTNALAALAMIATAVPGTVWLELSMDRRRLLMHVYEMGDPDAFVIMFKSRYESALREIFE
jgi:multicomponent K+:H+ antiporter subunit E